MIFPDVNLLIYAVSPSSPFHKRAKMWLESVLSSSDRVGLSFPSLLGFMRLTTNRRIAVSPMSIEKAVNYIEGWLAQPNTVLVVPTQRHWPILAKLLLSTGAAGNLTTDAHLAALAIEHGYTLYSNDADFARFEGLNWKNPLKDA